MINEPASRIEHSSFKMLCLAQEKQNSCVGEGERGIEGFGVAGQDIQRGPGIFNLSHVTDFPGSDNMWVPFQL